MRREVEAGGQTVLAELLSLARGSQSRSESGWSTHELGAIWRHQLDVPLVLDLGDAAVAAGAAADGGAYPHQGRPLHTFADLLRHPRPPIELLQLLKDFSRVHAADESSGFPVAAATVLYYAAITLALLRLDVRITSLDKPSWISGLRYAARRAWLDDTTRELFRTGLQQLGAAQ